MWSGREIILAVAMAILIFIAVKQQYQIGLLSQTTHNTEIIEWADYAGRPYHYKISREVHV